MDEFVGAFEGKLIYSIDDFYLRYDQLQLALQSIGLTIMQIPLSLVYIIPRNYKLYQSYEE